MPLYHAPESFVKRLAKYDPMLRVRWSDYERCWLIERKARRGRFEYGTSPNPEVRQRFHDGYVHVFSVPQAWLDDRVIKALGMGDLWKNGGARELNRQMDDAIEYKERRDDWNQKDDLRYIANEMFNYKSHLEGSRLGYGGRVGS